MLPKGVSVTLVEPKGPVNVGHVARLVQNFGVEKLYLVEPKVDLSVAAVYASHASGVLDRAIVTDFARVRKDHQLLVERSEDELVRVCPGTMGELVRKKVSPDVVFALSVQGRQTGLEELAEKVRGAKNPCVLVGGFPRGHFSPETLALADEVARIHPRPLEAHVVAARVVYGVEKAVAGFND